MSIHKDQKGFTLVEVVVVAALIMILATFSLNMMGRFRYAKSEQVVESISSALSKHQLNCMSKGKSYLHIYKLNNEYYIKVSSSNSSTVEDENGYSIGSHNVIKKMVKDAAAATEITGTGQLILSYNKDGSFDFVGDDLTEILVTGANEFKIKLNKSTGKHVVE